MNLLVRSCAVRPTVCRREDKRMRFCLMKENKVCELRRGQKKQRETKQCVLNLHLMNSGMR